MKKLISTLAVLVVVIAGFGIYQISVLRKAHSTFENYYAFRGCQQLVSRTSDAGYCKLASGQTIKIVKYDNKWYLDGDLPVFKWLN